MTNQPDRIKIAEIVPTLPPRFTTTERLPSHYVHVVPIPAYSEKQAEVIMRAVADAAYPPAPRGRR